MTADRIDIRAHYDAHGYAHLYEIAPPAVARGLLGLISRDLTARPETLARMLKKPSVNTRPAYEFYGYHYAPVMGFHWGLTSRICEVTGKRLIPTYAYFRVYQQGDVCTVHSDRPSCEHSLSMPLGYSDGRMWSFAIGRNHYEFEVASKMEVARDFGDEPYSELQLNPGDAVLYKGVNYRHGRIAPNPNRWSAHLFLHWIDSEGPYKEWAFDKQALPPVKDFPFPAPGVVTG